LNRATTAKSNIFENKPEETKYFFRDIDNNGEQLTGKNLYSITQVEVHFLSLELLSRP